MTQCRYNIFISSTFKDMDAERDMIKYNVIPLLNHRYRSYGIEFHAIDLRLGINTEKLSEEDSENMVLDVCLSMIDSSRPFFIALIGDRYGWIPQEKRLNSVLARLANEKRRLVVDGVGCSVTELEILYGAIGDDGANIDRSLFFVRDNKSYNGISEDAINIYRDKNNDKIESLKTRVHDLLVSRNKQDLYIGYSLKWNNDSDGRFDGLEEFGRLVFDRMCREIDAELSNLSQSLRWYEYVSKISDFICRKNCERSSDLYDVASFVEMTDDCHKMMISGDAGTGKSVLLSQIYDVLKTRDDVLPLISLVESISDLDTLNNVLFLWIYEMEQKLSLQCTPDTVMSEKNPYKLLYDRFYEIVDMLKDKGIRVVCLLDGIEVLSVKDYGAIDLMWVRNDITFVYTCDARSDVYDILRLNVSREVCLNELRLDVAKMFFSAENAYNINLPDRLIDMMESDKVSPMLVRLFMTMVSNLTIHDFSIIRNLSEGSEIDKINNYMVELYQSLPKSSIADVFSMAVSFISERLDTPWIKDAVSYIVSSRTGLRVKDISLLIGEGWDELKFIVFVNMFDDFFSENKITKLWTMNCRYISDAFVSERHTAALCECVAKYPDDDSVKLSYLAYYAVRARDVMLIDEYLCGDDNFVYDDGVYWSHESLSYIRDEMCSVGHIQNSLSPSSRIRFLYTVITSVPRYSNDRCRWYAEFVPLLLDMHEPLENKEDLYGLATLVNYAVIYKSGIGDSRLIQDLIKEACMSYGKCYEADPSYKDVRNMYKVAMMNLADTLAESGDFDGAMSIYQSIGKL